MTNETLRRLMIVQLEKARETLQMHIEHIRDLEHQIANTLAVVESETKNVKE